MPSQNSDPSNPRLLQTIADRISAHPQHRITFADFMQQVLYDADHGYYATNQAQIGVAGDFFTSPHLGPDFGELLAAQFLEMWEIMGRPQPFTLIEMGAGQGLVAADILKYLALQSAHQPEQYADFWAALDYIIIEKAEGLIAEQQRLLQPFTFVSHKVQWLSFDQLPASGIEGCFFSNELVDALPVHQFVVQQGIFQEVFVTLDPSTQTLIECLAPPSTPQLVAYLQELTIDITDYADGYRSEINLAALDWLTTVAQNLRRGYVLTIDYGYLANQYYSPQRPQGTLQCFYRHGAHLDPYAYLGHQDITAHANFSALELHGLTQGLTRLGYTQQGLFLMALGLGDRLVTNNTTQDLDQLNEVLRRREALQSLINPLGLGGFQVLIQGKGLDENAQNHILKGLQTPSF